MNKCLVVGAMCAVAMMTVRTGVAQDNPFLGCWALTPQGGGAGWLELRQGDGLLEGTLLWMGGSPEPQTRVWIDGTTLCCLRVWHEQIRDSAGTVVKTLAHPVSLTAQLAAGEEIRGTLTQPSSDGASVWKEPFSGVRIPALPPQPDLTRVRLGDPIRLFDGTSLHGWAVIGGAHWTTLTAQNTAGAGMQGWVPQDENVANGWSVQDGVLSNDPVQPAGQPWIRYGNLQTLQDFEDFQLTLEVNVPAGGNSGIYLRGIYEVQVADTYGRPLDSHHMGAIYGRIAPTTAAEKPAGQWQTLDIMLVDRHATVKLNNQTIIDNQPIAGCTGGALWSDPLRRGPIYLQGDHTAVQFRNIVLRPVVK